MICWYPEKSETFFGNPFDSIDNSCIFVAVKVPDFLKYFVNFDYKTHSPSLCFISVALI